MTAPLWDPTTDKTTGRAFTCVVRSPSATPTMRAMAAVMRTSRGNTVALTTAATAGTWRGVADEVLTDASDEHMATLLGKLEALASYRLGKGMKESWSRVIIDGPTLTPTLLAALKGMFMNGRALSTSVLLRCDFELPRWVRVNTDVQVVMADEEASMRAALVDVDEAAVASALCAVRAAPTLCVVTNGYGFVGVWDVPSPESPPDI
jgi:hypothetical protein